MIAITLLAAFLRLSWLDVQSIAFDESFSLAVGRANWPTLIGALLSDGVHPPLFYVVHKGALDLWGTSEYGQRFLAAVFGILAVPLTYRAGRAFFDGRTALLAALLLTLNPLHVWFAQEARMYSLLAVLTLASMVVFWQAVRTNHLKYWLALAVTNSLIYILHYFGFLIPFIQFIFILSTFGRNYRSLRPWATAQFVAFLPLIPWLIATAMRETQTFGIGFLLRPSLPDFLISFWNLAAGSSNLLWPVPILVVLIVGLALISALRPIAPNLIWPRQAQRLTGLWVLLPLIIIWLASQRRSFYADRYLTFAIPGLMLLLAYGAARLKRTQVGILLSIGLVLVSGYSLRVIHLDPAFSKDNWRGAASYVSQNELPADVVLLYTAHSKLPFDYYYRGLAPQKPISYNQDRFPIDSLTAGYQRAWVVYPYTRRPTHYPMQPLITAGYWADDPTRDPYLVDWLAAHTPNVVDYRHFRGVELWLVDLSVRP
jgi:uncharacterized membrane protein